MLFGSFRSVLNQPCHQAGDVISRNAYVFQLPVVEASKFGYGLGLSSKLGNPIPHARHGLTQAGYPPNSGVMF